MATPLALWLSSFRSPERSEGSISSFTLTEVHCHTSALSKLVEPASQPLPHCFVLCSRCQHAWRKPRTAGASNSDEESVKKFLQRRDRDKKTQYLAVFHDLNGDGIPEAIVYLIGNEWCGSRGCRVLILQKSSGSWKVVTSMTITNPPIRILAGTSNGWRSLGVWVQGGGIQPGYEAELRFNGKTYPKNPSAPPARRAAKHLAGEVVIRSINNAKPLW